ncbi:MAG: N-acetylmuramoyl-L-alanine amidase, partial [Alistipes sp.]
CIQQQYVKAGRHDRGIKPQLLRVLYATDMPCVLTEIGFMSNSDEAAYLRSERGQKEIASSLFKAVQNYANYLKGMREADEPIANQLPDEQSDNTEKTSTKKVTPQPVKEPVKETVAEPVKVEPQPATQEVKSTEKVDAADGYAVQLLASPERIALSSERFKEYKGVVKQYMAQGKYCYKYCVGFNVDRRAVQRQLAEVRRNFPDAFVVHCVGNNIVK